MNELFYGSICLTDLIEKAKQKHSAFKKVESNGKIYADVQIWLNKEPDKFGNVMQAKLGSKKELQEKEGSVYIGNFKRSERQEKPVSDNDLKDVDDLPF